MTKTYDELIQNELFEQRFNYLVLKGKIVFGIERYLNQMLYRSREWRTIRRDVIVRDQGCDLGIIDRKIFGRIIVHHINPITITDIERQSLLLFDMNNLICCSDETHNAIHYGDKSLLSLLPKERTKGDTSLWTAFSQQ